MKKLFAFLLVAVMIFSLAACGGDPYEKAAKEIEEIIGKEFTVDDLKEAMEELGALSDEEVTPEDVVEFYREAHELGDNDEEQKWPTEGYGASIPEPDWEYEITRNDDYSFNITFEDRDVESLRPYIEQLEAAGYEKNSERGEGDTWYYLAVNSDKGWQVTLEDGRLVVQEKR